ncbi:MAG TPA: hypothetical protein VHL77_02100 [Ferruginibacter sp.]|nr:hypothetical protein [Ferruginibacter sp.]
MLGTLEPCERFRAKGGILHQVITPRPMNTTFSTGTMSVYNFSTGKAEWKFCREKVEKVS